MVCTVRSLKIVGDNNSLWQLDSKYSDKIYWKCEMKEYRVRLHTILNQKMITYQIQQ